jgi:TM2 domain-containing membrane protein YozV
MPPKRRKKSSEEIPPWGWWVIGGFLLIVISAVLWVAKGPATGLIPIKVVAAIALIRPVIKVFTNPSILTPKQKSSLAALQKAEQEREMQLESKSETENMKQAPRLEQPSAGNVIAGIASFVVPGLGQLVQGRTASAVAYFLIAALVWYVVSDAILSALTGRGWVSPVAYWLPFICHVAAAHECATYKGRIK